MKNIFKNILTSLCLLASVPITAQISGTVFRDYNGNGIKGSTSPNLEPGVGGIIVNAYNFAESLIATATTTANGTYSLATGSSQVRVEFVIPNNGICTANPFLDFSTFGGALNSTSVRFINGASSGVDYGINLPEDFTTILNPNMFVPLLHKGDPLGGGTSGSSPDQIVRWSYNNSGTSITPTNWVSNNLIGSIYGQAYSKPADRLFFSALVKRQHGLGPLGSGGIYLVNPNTANTVTNFYNLDANGFATRASSGPLQVLPNSGGSSRNLNNDLNGSCNDPSAFDQVGKTGIGDLDATDDGNTLVLTNLFDRGIYRLSLNNPTNPSGVSSVSRTYLTNDGTAGGTSLATATQGVLRPYGISIYRGEIYVGVVATGENRNPRLADIAGTPNLKEQANDLFAYVYKMNLSTGAWIDFNTSDATPITPVISFPLNYTKGKCFDIFTGPGTSAYQEGWNAWTSNYNDLTAGTTFTFQACLPQPMLSDINFDDNGSMILNFRDRTGDQQASQGYGITGNQDVQVFSGGDILRVGYNASTCSYTLENNANDGNITSLGANNGEGPGSASNFGEFYYHDRYRFFGDSHFEVTLGSSAKLRGDERVISTIYDPTEINEIGVAKFSGITGSGSDAYRITLSGNQITNGTESKGNGLGDIEILQPSPPLEIGNRIWNDANGDGIQNAGEAGIAGVVLELTDATGNPVDSDPSTAGIQPTYVTTDALGNWTISSATGADGVVTNGSPLGVNNGVNLLPNTAYKVKLNTTLVGNDWDATANGGAGGPRAGSNLAGVQLTKTDKQGNGAADMSDNDAALVSSIPEISVTTGVNGQNNHSLDFGFKPLASIGNRIWRDDNKDGQQTPGEPGVAGVTVTLKNSAGVVIATTVTDAYGNYLFDNLVAGDYSIQVTPPANYQFTTQTNTTDDNNTSGPSTTGSDVNAVTGASYVVTLSAGENNSNVDAGLVFNTPIPSNSIGDRVWYDLNQDGVQDAGEPGMAGVTVTLFAADGVTVVATTVTDANGNYNFTGLPEGTNYIVKVTPPSGMLFSPSSGTTAGNASVDSDVNASGTSAVVNTGVAGNQVTGIDAGLYPQPLTAASLGDRVWNDVNQNGVQDAGEGGVGGVVVTLFYDANRDGVLTGAELTPYATTTTDAFGNYTFNNLPTAGLFQVQFGLPAGYTRTGKDAGSNDGLDSDASISDGRTGFIALGNGEHNSSVDAGIYLTSPAGNLQLGDKVYNDQNGDGQQGASEAGVPGVTVKLYQNGPDGLAGTADDVLVGTTTTDINGNYLFSNLAASSNAATNYNVQFSNIPNGYGYTVQDQGADASDSDVNSLGVSNSINLTASNFTIDAGIRQGVASGLGSVGNTVWYDLNNNGIQDAGELGVAGVTVELLNATGAVVGTTTTNALGEYMFTGLASGTYSVRFSSLPIGSSAAPVNTGSNDGVDSDATFAGAATATTTATTATFTLAAGEDNLTVDMGIVPPANTNTLGNFVWFDTNNDGVQDTGEKGMAGVSVTLFNNLGVAIGNTVTDANGQYLFAGLADGSYSVGFNNLPAGFDFTTKDVANNASGTRSAADRATGRTGQVSLGAGNRNDRSLDAGIVSTRAVLGDKVFDDKNGDGVQDAGEGGVAGVAVTLYAADGVTVVSSTVSDQNGNYLFANLLPGTYVVGFGNLPAGMELTQQNGAGDNGNNTNSDANPLTGLTAPITLSAGEVDLSVDAGIRTTPTATVGNLVWDDLNGDGVQQANEPGIAGVVATLYNSAGVAVSSSVTDGNGNWLITNVPPGTGYYVQFTNAPVGGFTGMGAGTVDTDNNANSSGITPTFNVLANTTNISIDAGIKATIALPQSFVSFAVNKQGAASVLNFNTGLPSTGLTYVVERSANGISFVSIGSILGSTANSYTYVDATPLIGRNYYRIRVTNASGAVAYTVIRMLNYNKDVKVQTYPNPVVSSLQITLPDMLGSRTLQLQVYNNQGQLVLSKIAAQAATTEVLAVDKLAAGSYLLKVSSQGMVVSTQKFIKK